MGPVRKPPPGRGRSAGKSAQRKAGGSGIEIAGAADRAHGGAEDTPPEDGHETNRGRRLRQGVAQFPMQILVPEETREALRQRSEDTGASIRHIILRSLAADGIPVPRLVRRRS